jgi:hypothetical protein
MTTTCLHCEFLLPYSTTLPLVLLFLPAASWFLPEMSRALPNALESTHNLFLLATTFE